MSYKQPLPGILRGRHFIFWPLLQVGSLFRVPPNCFTRQSSISPQHPPFFLNFTHFAGLSDQFLPPSSFFLYKRVFRGGGLKKNKRNEEQGVGEVGGRKKRKKEKKTLNEHYEANTDTGNNGGTTDMSAMEPTPQGPHLIRPTDS